MRIRTPKVSWPPGPQRPGNHRTRKTRKGPNAHRPLGQPRRRGRFRAGPLAPRARASRPLLLPPPNPPQLPLQPRGRKRFVADGDEWASSDALLALEQDIWRAEVKEWEDEERFLREQEAREEKVSEDEKRQWREWEDALGKEQWRGLLAEAHRARMEGVRRESEKLAVGSARLLEAKGCGFEVDWSIVL